MRCACRSRRIAQSPRTARTYKRNGKAPMIMKTTPTHCTLAENSMNERSLVE